VNCRGGLRANFPEFVKLARTNTADLAAYTETGPIDDRTIAQGNLVHVYERHGGVAVLLAREGNVEIISSRIIRADMRGWRVICTYAPHEANEEDVKEGYWTKLEDAVRRGCDILCGDLNAGHEPTRCRGTTNYQRLETLANNEQLRILETSPTWRHWTGNRRTLDRILVSDRLPQAKARVVKRTLPTDHLPLVLTLDTRNSEHSHDRDGWCLLAEAIRKRRPRKPWITQSDLEEMERRPGEDVKDWRRRRSTLARRLRRRAAVTYMTQTGTYWKWRRERPRPRLDIPMEELYDFYAERWKCATNPLQAAPHDAGVERSPQTERREPTVPSSREVNNAIRKLKTGRARGADGLRTEDLRNLPLPLRKALLKELAAIWRSGIPPKWREVTVVPIPKSKDLKSVTATRPISMGATGLKLTNLILLSRHQRTLEALTHPNQFARKGCGRAVTTVLERLRKEWRCMIALDFSRAYDSVFHKVLGETVTEGVPDSWDRELILQQYRDIWATVKQAREVSRRFKIQKGMRQGDPLSLILFEIAVARIHRALEGTGCDAYSYVDDIILVANSQEEAERGIRAVRQAGLAVGLELNLKKCRTLWRTGITPSGQLPEQALKAAFAGIDIGPDGDPTPDIPRRIHKAREAARNTLEEIAAFNQETKIGLSAATQRLIMRATVIVHLEYLLGDLSAFLTVTQKEALRKAENDLMCLVSAQVTTERGPLKRQRITLEPPRKKRHGPGQNAFKGGHWDRKGTTMEEAPKYEEARQGARFPTNGEIERRRQEVEQEKTRRLTCEGCGKAHSTFDRAQTCRERCGVPVTAVKKVMVCPICGIHRSLQSYPRHKCLVASRQDTPEENARTILPT
jgi:hypothetical protein